MEPDDLRAVELELCRISDVRAVRIVAGADQRPVEVHVLAVPGKHPKQLVRDVQSVALALMGLELDHRIISVVQLDDPEPEGPPAGTGARRTEGEAGPAPAGPAPPPSPTLRTGGRARLRVESIHAHRQHQRWSTEVSLRRGERLETGTREGLAASTATLRLVAEATVASLQAHDDTAAPLTVETAMVTRVGDRAVCLVTLILVAQGGEELLTGSSPVREAGQHEAVARAVLDAVNRRLAGRP